MISMRSCPITREEYLTARASRKWPRLDSCLTGILRPVISSSQSTYGSSHPGGLRKTAGGGLGSDRSPGDLTGGGCVGDSRTGRLIFAPGERVRLSALV